MQMPTLSYSLPNGTNHYRKTMLATNSTPPRGSGILLDSSETPHKERVTSIEDSIDAAPGAVELGIFLPQLANWTTAAACATAATVRAANLEHCHGLSRRDLLDVLALWDDCHQPAVHGKRLPRDQINHLHVVTIEYNLVKGLLDLVCQLGGSIHTQEARETSDHLAEAHVSCCIWQNWAHDQTPASPPSGSQIRLASAKERTRI